MNAVIYARYSSHAQREESIEGQLRVCYEYAAREGISVIEEYIDRAISGTTDDRPAFRRMISDSASRNFDIVLVYAVDRFARDRYAAATYRHELKKHGVKIVSVTQPLSDGPESILLEAMLEGLAEYYSANLARGVKRGMRENALKCLSVGGPRILGYTTDPATKKYVIDPVEENTVVDIFEQYDSGKTLAAVVEHCNERGYLTSKGKPFTRSSLTTILRNRRYIGYYIYDDIEIEDGMPAIVERDLFDSVQRRLEMNHRSKSRAKSKVDFMLTGKLFCGHCGRPMAGTSGRSKNGDIHYYYSCRIHGNKCIKQNERKEVIEEAIISYISSSFLTDENIDALADGIMQLMQESETAGLIEGLKAEKNDIRRKKKNVLNMIADGGRDPDLLEMLDDFRNREDDIDAQIARAELEQNVVSKDMIRFFLSRFKAGDEFTQGARADIIDALVSLIYIYDIEKNQNGSECSDRGSNGLGRRLVIAFNTSESVENTVSLECSDLVELVDYSSLYPNITTKSGTFYILERGRMIIAVVDI